MSEMPKVFGKLGLDVSRLTEDVSEAKKLLVALSKEANELGNVFNKLGMKTNFGDMSKDLEKMSSSMKSVTKDVAKEVEKSTKKLNYAQNQMVNIIKRQVKMGKTTPQNALDILGYRGMHLDDELKKYKKMLRDLKWELDGVAKDSKKATQINKDIDKVKNSIIGINKELQNVQVAEKDMTKVVQAEASKQTKAKEKSIKDQIKAKDRQKTREWHMMEDGRAKTEEQARKDAEAFVKAKLETEKQMTLNNRQMWKKISHTNKMHRIDDLNEQKLFLERELNNRELTVNQRRQLQYWLAQVKSKLRKQEEMEVKKHNNQLLRSEKDLVRRSQALNREALKRQGDYFNSPQQKFRSLSNYAFDATLLYGSVRAVRELERSFREIEAESINIARIMPNASENDIGELRDNAFDVAHLTAQQVTDVQKIQFLWAKTSDKLAENKQALEELSQVTSVGLNVGGFESADEAVTLLNASLNQMQLEWADASNVMDSWVKIADTTTVGTAKDLGDATMRMGAMANQLKLDYHDINAITGVLANNMAKSGEEIGTAMKTMFSYLQKESTIKILDKYGVQVMRNAKEYNSFINVMEQLKTVYAELQADSNNKAISEINQALGRVRRVDYIGTLISNWGEYNDIVETSMESTGYSMKQNEAITESYQSKINQLQNAFRQLAWAIGDSGLINDLTHLVEGLTRGIQTFTEIDPAVTRFMLTLLEASAIMVGFSKATSLLTGSSLIKWLSNVVLELSYMAGKLSQGTMSQWLFNQAKKAGADIELKESVALATNTNAIEANTGAKIGNVAIAPQMVSAINQGRASLIDSTGAVVRNTTAITTLGNSQKATTGMTGILAGSIKALINPITLLVGGVSLAIAGYTAWNKHKKEAIKLNKKIAESEKEIADMLSKQVVDEYEIPQYEERVGKIEEVTEQLAKSRDKLQRAMSELGKGDGMVGGLAEVSALRKEIESLEEQLRLLGVTEENAKEITEDFNELIAKSSNSVVREAYKSISLINKEFERNDKMRDYIKTYKQLSGTIKTSSDRTDEYNRVVKMLTLNFPQFVESIDKATGATILNTDAMEKQVGQKGELRDSQLKELQMTANLSDEVKEHAKNVIQAQINITQKVVDKTKKRVNAIKTELQAKKALTDVDQYRIKYIMSKSSEQRTIQEEYWAYNYGRFHADANNKIRAYEASLAEIERLEGSLKVLNTVNPYDSLGDFEGEDGSDNGDSITRVEADRHYKKSVSLAKINNEVEKYNRLMSKSKGQERIRMLKAEVPLLERKQDALHQLANSYRAERNEARKQLEGMGFIFNGDVITNYMEQFSQLTGDSAEKAKELSDTFEDIVRDKIPSLQQEWLDTENNIADANKEVEDIIKQQMDDRLELYREVEDKILEITKQRIEDQYEEEKEAINDLMDEEDKRHSRRLDNLERERSEFQKAIQDQLKAIDRQSSEDDYNDGLSKLESERLLLQDKFNQLQLDTSDEGRARALELEQQIADKTNEINELKEDRNTELRRNSLEDQLAQYEEDVQYKIDAENRKYEAEKERLENELRETERVYDEKLKESNLYHEALKKLNAQTFEQLKLEILSFEEEYGRGAKAIGNSIETNIINKLQQVKTLMRQLGFNGVGSFEYTLPSSVNSMLSSSVPQLDTGGYLDFDTNNGKLLFAHKGEIVLNPVETKDMLKASMLLKTSIPSFQNLLTSLSTKGGTKTIQIDSLIRVDGSIASDKLNNTKQLANDVLDELYILFKKEGIM